MFREGETTVTVFVAIFYIMFVNFSGIMSLFYLFPVSEKLVRHLPGGRGLVGSLCSWWRS